VAVERATLEIEFDVFKNKSEETMRLLKVQHEQVPLPPPLVTYNLYYSEEDAAFTSQYPIDKKFLDSLVVSFDKIGQNACEMVESIKDLHETSTAPAPIHASVADETQQQQMVISHHHHDRHFAKQEALKEVESLLEFCAKRLIINFEKSKAYSIAKLLESIEDGTTTCSSSEP
jgi:hypothetical protein